MQQKEDAVIQVKDLYKVYRMGEEKVYALNGVSFEIHRGEFCAITGPSGSGKSTLLNMLAGLEHPTKGEIVIAGKHIEKLNEKQLVTFRRERVGFIFQSYNLIGTMDAVENVALPLSFRGIPRAARIKRAKQYLKLVGLDENLYYQSPFDLSGGQKRRVAIAGVLAMKPDVLILDEPTAGLDPKGREDILNCVKKLRDETGITVILVSHSMEDVARYVDRIMVMNDGILMYDDTPQNVFAHYKELEKIGLSAPQVTYIMNDMKKNGWNVDTDVLTIEDARDSILRSIIKK